MEFKITMNKEKNKERFPYDIVFKTRTKIHFVSVNSYFNIGELMANYKDKAYRDEAEG